MKKKSTQSKNKFIFFFCCLILFLTLNKYKTALCEDTVRENRPSTEFLKPEKATGLYISSVEVVGISKTNKEFIQDRIVLKNNTLFTIELLDKTIKNLQNLQILTVSKTLLIKDPNDPKKLKILIQVDEKWTMLPYLLAGSGGGSSYFAIGFYDTNFLKRVYTFNFTYGCKNGNCSTIMFFRNPGIYGGNINLVLYPGLYHTVRNIYNKDRVLIGSFANKQKTFLTYSDFKITPSFSIGAGLNFQDNQITNEGLNDDEISGSSIYNFQLPPSTSSTALEARITWGEINYNGMLIDGTSLTSIIDTTAQVYKNSNDNYTSINNTLLFFRSNIPMGFFSIPLPRLSYLAMRTNLSLTTSNVHSQQYFIGGFDKVRGFYDDEFFGKFSWFNNIEFRIPSFVNEYLALQHVLFSDAGAASNRFPDLFSKATALSVGLGIRVLPLKISKVAFRLDYGYTLNPFRTYGFSFGLFQLY